MEGNIFICFSLKKDLCLVKSFEIEQNSAYVSIFTKIKPNLQ